MAGEVLLGELRGHVLGPYKIVQQVAASWGGPDSWFVSRLSLGDWICRRALQLELAAGAAAPPSENQGCTGGYRHRRRQHRLLSGSHVLWTAFACLTVWPIQRWRYRVGLARGFPCF